VLLKITKHVTAKLMSSLILVMHSICVEVE